MRIKEITWRLANDFHADLQCEHCGHIQKLTTGYNDAYYHTNVLPAVNCESCGKDRAGNVQPPQSEKVPQLKPISTESLFSKLADIAFAFNHSPINKEPGAWTVDLDDQWRLAVNAHKETITLPADDFFLSAKIDPCDCIVWFNGFIAAVFNPFEGTFADGGKANPTTFIAAIDSMISRFKQPQPPDAPQPWRYVGK